MTCYICFAVEVDDMKKISTSLTALLSEKQRQEKVLNTFLGTSPKNLNLHKMYSSFGHLRSR